MSFTTDQFMQVKCKFQLTSETDSSETLHSLNNERVRLCTSVDIDKNSTLIVLICSNDVCNNHIITYYIEKRRQHSHYHINHSRQQQPQTHNINNTNVSTNNSNPAQHQQETSSTVTNFSDSCLNLKKSTTSQRSYLNTSSTSVTRTSQRVKPRVIVKQIYYHTYNEDIVAICLSNSGSQLVLINASSTIYVIPIKNILLNLHAQQLKFSQGRSMYFYDAKILNCCTIESPTSIAYWESDKGLSIGPSDSGVRSYVIVANKQGKVCFVNIEDKNEVCSTKVGEHINKLDIIRDRFSNSLLITCASYRQYRLPLDLTQPNQHSNQHPNEPTGLTLNQINNGHNPNLREGDTIPAWDRKPTLIQLHNGTSPILASATNAAAALQRIFVPTARHSSQSSLLTGFNTRERSLPMIFNHPPLMVSVVDVLGAHKVYSPSQNVSSSSTSSSSSSNSPKSESRHIRFFSSRQYYSKVQKPLLVCRINTLDADEMILHVVLTARFLAVTTDHNRCLIMSRNCCDLWQAPNAQIKVDPILKEITFNNEEKIMLLIKSPAIRDQDGIIDSFLLVTTKSIYSFEARQSCRDMYINLIDSHLSISLDKTAKMPASCTGEILDSFYNRSKFDGLAIEDSKSSLIINNFLNQRDEVYERITYDSRAFSIWFKLDLNSLYEAYADRSLLRGKYDLANRFFQMARFNHSRILGKYIRLGAYNQSIDYCTKVLSDDNEILDERERLDLAKAAFECLLAKTLVERSKLAIYKSSLLKECLNALDESSGSNSNSKIQICHDTYVRSTLKVNDLFSLCDHSPQNQGAKLSATTIVPDDGDINSREEYDRDRSSLQEEEDTLTGNQKRTNFGRATRNLDRLGCEKALIDFVRLHVPPSLHSYVMTHLADFDLLELVEAMIGSDYHIPSILRALMRPANINRLIFRDETHRSVIEKLKGRRECADLIAIDNHKPKFLEFITSHEATKSMVRDISLASEYLGYRHTFVQFRRYSFTASHQFDSYRKLVLHYNQDKNKNAGESDLSTTHDRSQNNKSSNLRENQSRLQETGKSSVEKTDMHEFTEQQRKFIGGMFVIFLNAALDESTEDACRLWFNYINFYLNYVGTLNQLESDIIEVLDSNQSDCRFAVALYKSIHRDENLASSETFFSDCIANTPLETLKNFYSPSKLFENEFLMKLLEKTLDLVQQSADIEDALSIAAMC